jgi:hypothetical protein
MAKTTTKTKGFLPRKPAAGRAGSSPDLGSRRSISALASAIRLRLAALENGASQREMVAQLERYARAIARWDSVAPTEAQCTAMLEQLATLDERAQSAVTRDDRAPASARPAKPRRLPATTTKMPRVTTTTKMPRVPKA